MSLVEPLTILLISLFGIGLAAGLFMEGVGDFFKTILLLAFSLYGIVAALTMTRKLEIAGSELIIHSLISKRVIARQDVDAYSLDEQGLNRRTRKFVTIYLVTGQRIKFKSIKEGNRSLLQALEAFTGLKPAVDSPGETTKSHS